MTLRVSDWQSERSLDSICNCCDVKCRDWTFPQSSTCLHIAQQWLWSGSRLETSAAKLKTLGEALLARRALRCSEALYKLQVAAHSRELQKCTSLVDFQSLWCSLLPREEAKQAASFVIKTPILYSLTNPSFLFAKDCLLTGQEHACTRITWLIVCHHAENGPIQRKIAVDCPLVTTSKVKPFSIPY